MKYGVLYNKNNLNIGDDIQAYATAQFLPTVDYFIDREHIDSFESDDKKAVGVIMNAWYMWAKWNWPPSKYILPHFVGFHYADHQLAKQPGTPIKYQFLDGIGGEYLKAYGPIGCRDKFTMGRLQERNIPAYFSGCITLTLPKMPETADKGSYICLVDIDEKVAKKIQQELEGKIEVKVFTHNKKREPDKTWEERLKSVEERLTIYQNARCVVTKRLHCALPCMAMEVPVFMVKGMTDDIRFDPYYDLLHMTTPKKFLADNYDYDFLNPPANKPDYKEIREGLIKSCNEFIENTKTMDDDAEKLDKTKDFYTPNDVIFWRHDVMKEMMDLWLKDARDSKVKNIKDKRKIDKLEKQVKDLKKKLGIAKEKKKASLWKRIKKKIKKIVKR